MLKALLFEGMGVARFNLAHGSRESHSQALCNLREALAETGSLCATMVVLAGLNVRTGAVADERPIAVHERQLFMWRCAASDHAFKTTERSGFIDCAELPGAVQPGMLLYIDDMLAFRIHEVIAQTIVCEALVDGELRSHQRVSCANAAFPAALMAAVAARDDDDAAWAALNEVDFIVPGVGDVDALHERFRVLKRIDDAASLVSALDDQFSTLTSRRGIDAMIGERSKKVALAAASLLATNDDAPVRATPPPAVVAAAAATASATATTSTTSATVTTPRSAKSRSFLSLSDELLNAVKPTSAGAYRLKRGSENFQSYNFMYFLEKYSLEETVFLMFQFVLEGSGTPQKFGGLVFIRNRLGIDARIESIPGAQRALSRLAAQHGPPLIVSSELLESMTRQPKPSRAEATGVCVCVCDM